MRFLLLDPLGNDKHSQMFHTSGFAIAAGVVAVGAAAGSAAISMSAADRAKKAQGAAGKKYQKQINQATKQFNEQQDQVKAAIAAIDPNLNIPEYNLKDATQEGIDVANQITANTLKELEKIVPGSSQARAQAMQAIGNWENNLNQQYQNLQANQALIDQQRGVVGSMLRGELTPVQQEQINRVIAERAGAGFNPATAGRVGGFQTAQAQLADQLRQSSEARILAGMQLAPGVNEQQRGLAGSSLALSEGFRGLENTRQTWNTIAQSFMQNVPQMMGIGLQGRGQDIQVKQYGIQNALAQQAAIAQINSQQFGALTGQAQNIYNVNRENIASSYAAQQAVGQGVSDIGKATSGALSGYSNVLAGFSYGGQSRNPYGTGLEATPLYNTPRSPSGTYYGGSPATGSMTDRPVALPT